jgi:hypothetical protein
MHFAIVVYKFARIVDDNAGVPGHTEFILFHDAKATPYIVL